MQKLKKLAKTISFLITIFLIVIICATLFSVLEGPGGYRLFIVLSGSMEPAIKTGSIVLVAPQPDYQPGEVITFLTQPGISLKNPNATVTHRLAEIKDNQYLTKGDANQDIDMQSITSDQILGKVIFSLPYLGYLISLTKSQLGFTFLIVVPATLIIYGELNSIKREIQKILAKKHESK